MYKNIIRPFLFSFSPERAHFITFTFLNIIKNLPGGLALLRSLSVHKNNPVNLMGLSFPNRIGLAAGLDKNASLVPVWQALGFGFAEIGTLTPKPQPGNPKPRLFRLVEDQALVNRMGFNNIGVDQAVKTIDKRPNKMILGGNMGKNTATANSEAVNDYLYVMEMLYPKVDYLVVNVSCPNISNLSKLQDKNNLDSLLYQIGKKRSQMDVYKPLVLKLSPDLNEIQAGETLELISKHGFDGIIATNTTITRDNLRTGQDQIKQIGNGGLSGKPLFDKSRKMVRFIRKEMGAGFPVIGSGGILSSEHAKVMFDEGADALQLYTGFIYKGTGLIKRCLQL